MPLPVRPFPARILALARTAQVARFGHIPLMIVSRLLNAAAGFLLIWHVSATIVGGYNYLMATVAIPISLFCFSLDVSLNTLLTRRGVDGASRVSAIVAGVVAVTIGTLLSTGIVAGLVLLLPNPAVQPPPYAIAILVGFCGATFVALFLNGVSYSLGGYRTVAIANLIQSGGLLLVVLAVADRFDSAGLLFAATVFLLGGSGYQVLTLRRGGFAAHRWRDVRIDRRGVAAELRRLIAYGSTQALVVTASFVALWILQAKITSERGLAATALYGVGNQFFNLVFFFPSIANPMIVSALTRLSSRHRAAIRFTMRLVAGFALLLLVLCAGAAVTLPILEGYMPPAYAGITLVSTLATAAAALQLVKTPMSIHFATRLDGRPDLVGAGAFVVVVAAGVLLTPNMTPVSAMAIRLAAQVAATATMGLLYAVSARRLWIAATD